MKAAEKEKDFQVISNEHGERFAQSAREELDAMKHARECDGTNDEGDPCTMGKDTDNPEAWHDEDSARRQIDEGPLEVCADKGERFDGSRHFMILLGTGGPASRITGELDQYGQPETATYQFQDWFKPWTDANLTSEEDESVLEYAQQFYFGE